MYQAMLAKLKAHLPEVWPLAEWVALNPLQGMTQQSFTDAVNTMSHRVGVNGFLSLTDYETLLQQGEITKAALEQAISQQYGCAQADLLHAMTTISHYDLTTALPVNEAPEKQLLSYHYNRYTFYDCMDEVRSECLHWLMNYHSAIPDSFAVREDTDTLYSYWLRMMQLRSDRYWRSLLDIIHQDVEQAFTVLIEQLAIPEAQLENYCLQILWQLKGWVGLRLHLQEDNLLEVLVIWLANEWLWQQRLKQTVDVWQSIMISDCAEQQNQVLQQFLQLDLPVTLVDYLHLWQSAYELTYQHQLARQLAAVAPASTTQQQPAVQMLFCIDVRSEPLRRELEAASNIQTMGFAGFFGFVFSLLDETQDIVTSQCPALLRPELLVKMQYDMPTLSPLWFNQANAANKTGMLSAFAWFELLGIWYIFKLIINNFATSLLSLPKLQRELSFEMPDFNAAVMADQAAGFLQGVGLTNNFAKVVVICGHSASTTANPYQAGYDCGACGGNGGLLNAIVACHVCNHPQVREYLAQQGILIPEETWFVPACHNTTIDQIFWYDGLLKDFPHAGLLQQLKIDAKQAEAKLRHWRLTKLPGETNVVRRAKDWAELIPEWGLVNNAAMIIAPRQLTESMDLQGRAFLHEYDAAADTDGAVLEAIMQGPMVVAHWINAQYYFSTVDPINYGAGNKAIHNVLPGAGVMEGNISDLKIGLPMQSVYLYGQRVHQPLRLTVIIDAPQERIDKVLAKNPSLQQLIAGQWLWLYNLEQILINL